MCGCNGTVSALVETIEVYLGVQLEALEIRRGIEAVRINQLLKMSTGLLNTCMSNRTKCAPSAGRLGRLCSGNSSC
jgi:hypothetical protein